MNESKSIVQRNKENTVEYKTVNSVKKAINKMKISTADSKDEFDEIAASIKKIDAFYEENSDRVSAKVLLKMYNSFNNVIPDFRAMILSFFVSFILLVFPYIINQVSDLQSTEISVVGLLVTMLFYYIVLLGLSIGIVFGLWAIAKHITSGKSQMINDHHKEVLEKIIKKKVEEKCIKSEENTHVSSSSK